MKFEEIYGKPPGHAPRSYWRPWLGEGSVSPAEVALLTPGQLMSAHRYFQGTE